MIRHSIEEALKQALETIGAGDTSFVLERPGSFDHGDYATNAALVAAKVLKKNPKEVAEELVVKLNSSTSLGAISEIKVAGSGFINFFLSRHALTKEVEAAAHDKKWGTNKSNANKKIMVEYTSPNLFKPLHIGNLVGNILGESIARVLEHSGAEIKRVNYPSDIGLTVAKGVWGLIQTGGNANDIKALGEAYRVGNFSYEEDAEAKKEIDDVNKALYEDSNPAWSSLREAGLDTSRKHLAELCAVLGTLFDHEFFESESGPIGRDLVLSHIEDRIFEKSDGAIVYAGEKEGLHTRVFLNSQGLPTYEAKEIGLFDLKSNVYPDFDISLTVTGGEQKEFFRVVFAALKKVFPERTEGKVIDHVANGFLSLTTGKMSSRKGNVITGESLLEDLKSDAREKMKERNLKNVEEISEQVAVGAIKYAVLKQGSGKDIVFDPEKSLSLEGDSGPYIQYAHTRAFSLIHAAEEAGVEPGVLDKPTSVSILERILIHFPDTLTRAAEELEPHYVTTYVTELASAFNSWYANERIIDGPSPHYGVLLTQAVEQTLAKGLDVLGIPAPEKM